MSTASALPYPPDEPDEIRSRARGLLSCGDELGDAAQAIEHVRVFLSLRWSGQAYDAAVAELAALAGITREAAAALHDGSAPLFAYAEALDEARTAIDSLRSSYDQLMAAAAPVGERARDESETRLSELGDLHREHASVLARTELTAELTGRALEAIGRRAAPMRRGATAGVSVEAHLLDRLPLLRGYRIATDGWGAEAARDLAEDLRRLLDAPSGAHDDDPSWDEVDPLLGVLRQRVCDPVFSATLLDLLGADAFMQLPDVVRVAALGSSGGDPDQRLLGGLALVSAALVTASHTVGRPGGLSQRFVDDLAGPDPDDEAASEDEPPGVANQVDQIQDALAAAGLADDVAAPVARAAGAGRLAAVLDGGGKLLVVTAVAAPVVDLVQGQWVDAAVSTATAGLAVAGVFAPPPFGFAAAAVGALITVVSMASTSSRNRPAATSPPDDVCHNGTGASSMTRWTEVPAGAGGTGASSMTRWAEVPAGPD